jgi:hypothetical protein
MFFNVKLASSNFDIRNSDDNSQKLFILLNFKVWDEHNANNYKKDLIISILGDPHKITLNKLREYINFVLALKGNIYIPISLIYFSLNKIGLKSIEFEELPVAEWKDSLIFLVLTFLYQLERPV